jgi:predicted permease
LVLLILGSTVLWLVLPRLTVKEHALAAFILGLALCESCAVLGMILNPEISGTNYVAVLAVLQFMPTFAEKYEKRPEQTGVL